MSDVFDLGCSSVSGSGGSGGVGQVLAVMEDPQSEEACLSPPLSSAPLPSHTPLDI